MRRNEQILSEVQKRFSNDKTHIVLKVNTFIDGAKWADEHPKCGMVNKQEFIERACELLKQIMYVEYIFEHDEDEKPVQYVCASACDSVNDFVNNFRKIMEE